MNSFLKRYSPPGMDITHEKSWLIGGLPVGILWSFVFFFRYADAYEELFTRSGGEQVLKPGAVIQPFDEIMGPSLLALVLVAFIMLQFLFHHWFYFYQGSRSIYLMKRLPQKGELVKRILILPVLAFFICMAVLVLVRFLYFGVYLLVTPDSCLPANVWQQF